ncbi:MAG: NUDIX domain-containing protein [Saprospiraceae bacterium]|nr:NUDIX domain-containing protein [Saprospiraceae bacterium]
MCTTVELAHLPAPSPAVMVARYPGKPKYLLNYADLLEKSRRFDCIIVYNDDVSKIWDDFLTLYTYIPAAGGLVFNTAGQILLIYRRNSWDLPKGKVDEGETMEEAAVREVKEETGLVDVQLQQSVGTTYHTYREKREKRILKETFWYVMKTSNDKLIPQAEEDIEQAVWADLPAFLAEKRDMYRSIREVLTNYLK